MPFFSGQAVLLTGSWSGATALPVPLTHPEHATPTAPMCCSDVSHMLSQLNLLLMP